MLNLIKMDLYRMFKMKSFYVILIIMASSIMFTTIVMKQTVKMLSDNPALEDVMDDDSQNIGITVGLKDDNSLAVDMLYISNVEGMSVALLMLIFVVLFSTSDFTSGFIKNIGGQAPSRILLVGSKAVAVIFYTIFNLAITLVFQIISNGIVLGEVEFKCFNESMKYIGVQLVLHIALSLTIMMVALIIRSNLVTMIIAVLSTMGIPSLAYLALEKLIPGHPKISKYAVTTHIMGLETDIYQRAIIVSAVFLIVAVIISGISYKKRDFV